VTGELRTLRAKGPKIYGLRLRDKKTVVVRDAQQIQCLDLSSGREVWALPHKVPDEGGEWRGLCLSLDGKWLALHVTHHKKSHFVIVETATGTRRAELVLPIDWNSLTLAAISPDGRTLACVEHNTITLFHIPTGVKLARYHGHRDEITAVTFTPDGRTL